MGKRMDYLLYSYWYFSCFISFLVRFLSVPWSLYCCQKCFRYGFVAWRCRLPALHFGLVLIWLGSWLLGCWRILRRQGLSCCLHLCAFPTCWLCGSLFLRQLENRLKKLKKWFQRTNSRLVLGVIIKLRMCRIIRRHILFFCLDVLSVYRVSLLIHPLDRHKCFRL